MTVRRFRATRGGIFVSYAGFVLVAAKEHGGGVVVETKGDGRFISLRRII